MNFVTQLAALLIAFNVACSAYELVPVEEWSWTTDTDVFTDPESRGWSRITNKYHYFYKFELPFDFTIKSIDRNNRSSVSCSISDSYYKHINANMNLLELGNNKILVESKYYHLSILDPVACTLDKEIPDVNCHLIQVNADTFDCLLATKPISVTRYNQEFGEFVANYTLNGVVTVHTSTILLHELEEPIGDARYFAWQPYKDDKIKLVWLNSTYGNLTEKYLPIKAGGSQFYGIISAAHNRLTVCPAVHHVWQNVSKQNYEVDLSCSSVDVSDPDKLFKFTVRVPNHGTRPFAQTFFVHNLREGGLIFLYVEPHSSQNIFYRFVNEMGEVDPEDRVFLELDEQIEASAARIGFYEEDGNFCGRVHRSINYVVTKCVKIIM